MCVFFSFNLGPSSPKAVSIFRNKSSKEGRQIREQVLSTIVAVGTQGLGGPPPCNCGTRGNEELNISLIMPCSHYYWGHLSYRI